MLIGDDASSHYLFTGVIDVIIEVMVVAFSVVIQLRHWWVHASDDTKYWQNRVKLCLNIFMDNKYICCLFIVVNDTNEIF